MNRLTEDEKRLLHEKYLAVKKAEKVVYDEAQRRKKEAKEGKK